MELFFGRYNAKDCVAYMAARMPANYAALSYIFNEVFFNASDQITVLILCFLDQM